MSHHPTFTGAARRHFCVHLSEQGHDYDTVAEALQAAGYPRPSQGDSEYRRMILLALNGSEGRFPPGWIDALDGAPPVQEGYLDALVRGGP